MALTRIEKLRFLIVEWAWNGKQPIKGITPVYLDCLIIAYNELKKKGVTTTSWEPVCEVLNKCGFKGVPDEHGVSFTYST